VAIALLSLSPNDLIMAQASEPGQPFQKGQATIQGAATSSGATITIAAKSQQDAATGAGLDAYGKLLAERLPQVASRFCLRPCP
jgi:hypothetical protein